MVRSVGDETKSVQEGKQFSVEEKNQNSVTAVPARSFSVPQGEKFFGSFFQKRTPSLLLHWLRMRTASRRRQLTGFKHIRLQRQIAANGAAATE